VISAVVLPDHLHAVIRLAEATDYSALWQDIKKGFTRRVAGAMSSPWQPRFWEHTIRDADDLRRHVDYVHINPMKHGLVPRLSEWPHSSFHRHVRAGWLPADWAGCVDGVDFGE
jgi:putative transposase